MSEFFRTQMGQRFYESTMPALVRELRRLNDNLERIVAVVERSGSPAPVKLDDASGEEPR